VSTHATSSHPRLPLDHYLRLDYSFLAHAEPDGGYTIVFPDLPGCVSVAESPNDVSAMAMDAKRLWMESAYELGREIPLPSQRERP
jgi:antitoxin HicB